MKNKITAKARNLRNNQTPAETMLWEQLRRESLGVKFRRQQPIRIKLDEKVQLFIADFYCSSAKLVIELDGKIHLSQKDYDQARDHLINQLDIRVIRFTNDQVLNDPEALVTKIKAILLSE